MSAQEIAYNFFSVYLAAPVVLVSYIGYKVVYKTKFIRPSEADLATGRRDLDVQHLVEQERAEQKQWPAWKKVYNFFC